VRSMTVELLLAHVGGRPESASVSGIRRGAASAPRAAPLTSSEWSSSLRASPRAWQRRKERVATTTTRPAMSPPCSNALRPSAKRAPVLSHSVRRSSRCGAALGREASGAPEGLSVRPRVKALRAVRVVLTLISRDALANDRLDPTAVVAAGAHRGYVVANSANGFVLSL
jgi:hypothetical protein